MHQAHGAAPDADVCRSAGRSTRLQTPMPSCIAVPMLCSPGFTPPVKGFAELHQEAITLWCVRTCVCRCRPVLPVQGEAEAQQEPHPSPEGIQAEPQPAQGLSSEGHLASGKQLGTQGPVSKGQQPGSALWWRAQVRWPLLHCCTCRWCAEPCGGLAQETAAPCAHAQACMRLNFLR